MSTGEEGQNVLQLEPKSLLKWSNPVGGSFHGSVFIWTADGRPQVIASVYKKYLPLPHHLGVEFHSLTEGPGRALRDGKTEWSPARAGIEFRKIPGAPAPGDTPERRLRQILRIGTRILRHEDGQESRDAAAQAAHPADLQV